MVIRRKKNSLDKLSSLNYNNSVIRFNKFVIFVLTNFISLNSFVI